MFLASAQTDVVTDRDAAAVLDIDRRLAMRAAVNAWIGQQFPEQHRTLLAHNQPRCDPETATWSVELVTKCNSGPPRSLGRLLMDDAAAILDAPDIACVLAHLSAATASTPEPRTEAIHGEGWELCCGDGIAAAAQLEDGSVDLLLTDPPYGISRRYTCEGQIPRRLRSDGSDFIMPRGHFGDWDNAIDPEAWTAAVLPKIRGWAVTFCAQAQIGIYSDIFTAHGFVAVGPMVWQKTNPVPFNHQHKPINAWEALVVGKRPGTPFNGRLVHNVFLHRSPSPQQRIHPTQKPLPLIAKFVDLFSQPGDLVLDPFAGSATTLVAASGARRSVIGHESDPAIFAAAAERLAALR